MKKKPAKKKAKKNKTQKGKKKAAKRKAGSPLRERTPPIFDIEEYWRERERKIREAITRRRSD